jgi:glycosyltransferase involved in cell wall biosynthesis
VFEAADIVVLPYRESYGSGVLLLAMSFGKAIVATDTGGMGEYAGSYDPIGIVPANVSPEELLQQLKAAAARLHTGGVPAGRPADLEWSAIVRAMLPSLNSVSRGMPTIDNAN